MVFVEVEVFVVFYFEFIHFFLSLISFSLSLLNFLIILGLDILNRSDLSNNTFLLLSLLLKFVDYLLEWLQLFIIAVDFFSEGFELIVKNDDLIVVFADFSFDFNVWSTV